MVRITRDLTFLPENIGTPQVRIALIVVLALIAIGTGLFLIDHLITRQPEQASPEDVNPGSIVLFPSPQYGTVTGTSLMHSGPGDDYSELGRLEANSQLIVLGKHQSNKGVWLIVQQYGDLITGWIKEENVELGR